MTRLAAVVAAVTLLAAPALAANPQLRTPSGNIGCEYEPQAAGRLLCVRLKPTVQSIILTKDGAHYGPAEYDGEVWFPHGAPVLAYGKSREIGPYTCQSETSGLTCRIGGKGFKASRAGITAF